MSSPPSPTETIYVRLLNEGTDVWRPTLGRRVGPMTFEVLPTPDYDPEDEEWEFVPGRMVVCRWAPRSGGPAFIASEPSVPPSDLRARHRSVLQLIGRSDPVSAPWIDTRIDGTPLEELVAAAPEVSGRKKAADYQGPDPSDLVPPHGRLLGGRGSVLLLVCAGCREPGCDPVSAAIEVFDGEVVWSEFKAGNITNRLHSVGPFVFDRKQYEAAVECAVDWCATMRRSRG